MGKLNFTLIFLCLVCFNTHEFRTQTILQTTYGVEENQLIIQSLDSTIAHFGDEKDKKIYKRCIQHYLEFQGLHIQREYSKSYERVRHTQKLLIPLYDRMIEKNIEIVRDELTRLARLSRDKEKTQTKTFFRLAFRDLAEAEDKLTIARNIRPYLYLLKLREMLFAIKILKHAGRFVVLLALLHDTKINVEIESTDFESINSEIERSFTLQKEKFQRIHWDNYFKIWNKDGVYSVVMHNPEMEELASPLPGVDPAYVRKGKL